MTNRGSHLSLIHIFLEKNEVGTCLFSYVCHEEKCYRDVHTDEIFRTKLKN